MGAGPRYVPGAVLWHPIEDSNMSLVERIDDDTQSSISRSQFDTGRVFRHHPLVFFIVPLAAIALGVIHFFKAPPTYESSVDILFEPKQATVLSAESYLESNSAAETAIATHIYSLTSPIIVRRALDTLRWPTDTSTLEEVVECLSVELVVDESNVVSLRSRSASPGECQALLDAIVECYSEFLGDVNEDVGKETTDLISQAKDDLMDQLRVHEKRYQSFRQNAPIIWQDGKGVNTHHERQLMVEETRAQLAIQQTELKSRIERMSETLARPNGKRHLYFEALAQADLTRDRSGVAADQVVDRENARVLADELRHVVAEEARLADEFGSGHPDVRAVRVRLKNLRSELASTEIRLSEFTASEEKIDDYVNVYVNRVIDEYRDVTRQIRELDAMFDDEQKLATTLQGYVSQDEALRSDIERTQRLFDAVVARLEEINIVRDQGGDRMHVMAPPGIGTQIAPTLFRSLSLAGAIGVVVAFALAYVLEIFEGAFRSLNEIRDVLGVAVVGVVPRLRTKALPVKRGCESLSPLVVTAHSRVSNASEAVRAVRTSMFFSGMSNEDRVIQVTSPLPGDGKSTLASNLAVAIAQTEKRVLLIDADFRKPTIHSLFGREKYTAVGLAELVRGEADLTDEDVSTDIRNLFVLSCGDRPENPSELLTGPNFVATLEMLRARFDYVILDTPPILVVTDPIAIAARVDAVLMVLRLRRGSRAAACRAREMLKEIDANLIGVVVNAVEPNANFSYGGNYGYGYGYGYGSYGAEQYREANENSPQLLLKK